MQNERKKQDGEDGDAGRQKRGRFHMTVIVAAGRDEDAEEGGRRQSRIVRQNEEGEDAADDAAPAAPVAATSKS